MVTGAAIKKLKNNIRKPGMKKYFNNLILLFILLIFSSAYSQDMNQLNFINSLDSKGAATYGDAVKLFAASEGARTGSFKSESAFLNAQGLALKYEEDAPLTRGMAALMTARNLNLKGSFMYLIFKIERYAYRACIADSLMPGDASEFDKLSGPELLELMSLISDKKGNNYEKNISIGFYSFFCIRSFCPGHRGR